MTLHLIETTDNKDLVSVTLKDLELQNREVATNVIPFDPDPMAQIRRLAEQDLQDSDVICFSGLVLRTRIWDLVEVATEKNINLMPGRITDHRGVTVPEGKFFSRKPQELNGYPGVPYVMIIGDAESAKVSWENLFFLDSHQIWKLYQPENLCLHHWLSAAAGLHPSWISPDWFTVADLSRQDLELTPVMYATNRWSDWIAFYPAAGQFKLENHAQINPVWLDHSTKTLEHWGHG